MKVFISWSGERSRALGQAIHEWLPMVLQHVSPWLSESDINAGDRWATKVGCELENSNFGIICNTRDNLSAPWLLFEAGALTKFMQEGRVVPLLLDIELSDLTGPLAQFQAKKVTKEGMSEVVTAINKHSSTPLNDTSLAKQFDALWSNFEINIAKIPANKNLAKTIRQTPEVLEELVGSIRGLDMRLRDTLDESPRHLRRRKKFHPMMIEEILAFSDFKPNDPIRILIVASFLKEDFPWIYELAQDAYHAAQGRSSRAGESMTRFVSAIKAIRRGPFMEMAMSDKQSYHMMDMIDHFAHRMMFDDSFESESPEIETKLNSVTS